MNDSSDKKDEAKKPLSDEKRLMIIKLALAGAIATAIVIIIVYLYSKRSRAHKAKKEPAVDTSNMYPKEQVEKYRQAVNQRLAEYRNMIDKQNVEIAALRRNSRKAKKVRNVKQESSSVDSSDDSSDSSSVDSSDSSVDSSDSSSVDTSNGYKGIIRRQKRNGKPKAIKHFAIDAIKNEVVTTPSKIEEPDEPSKDTSKATSKDTSKATSKATSKDDADDGKEMASLLNNPGTLIPATD